MSTLELCLRPAIVALAVMLSGCAGQVWHAAQVTVWHLDPKTRDYPIRLTNWPTVSLTVTDGRPIPDRLFMTWIDRAAGGTWEGHSRALVSEVQRVLLAGLGGRVTGDSLITLRVTVMQHDARFDSAHWYGRASVEAAVQRAGERVVVFTSSRTVDRFNWFGLLTAEGVAQDAFEAAMNDLLGQLYAAPPILYRASPRAAEH